MPAERIAMRQVRDVLRLKAAGVPVLTWTFRRWPITSARAPPP
jgi:hypothetical protein